jgi:tetratricopeptide (TPR) repeat protein
MCMHCSYEGSLLTPDSDLSRAIRCYTDALAPLPRCQSDRQALLDSEGMSASNQLMTLQLEATARQGLSQCHFQRQQHETAIHHAEVSIELMHHIMERETATHDRRENGTSAVSVSVRQREQWWRRRMTCSQIISFSHFHLSQYQEALDSLNEAFSFSTRFDQSSSVATPAPAAATPAPAASSDKQRPIERNRMLLKLIFLKNQVMLQMSSYDVSELNDVWEQIIACADCFATHHEYLEAGKLYKLAGEYFTSQSGRSAFNLSDSTAKLPFTAATQRANEVNALSAQFTRKSAYQLLTQLEAMTAGSSAALLLPKKAALSAAVHRQFISCVRVLFLRGICAESMGMAQRHFEAAHSMREEYRR